RRSLDGRNHESFPETSAKALLHLDRRHSGAVRAQPLRSKRTATRSGSSAVLVGDAGHDGLFRPPLCGSIWSWAVGQDAFGRRPTSGTRSLATIVRRTNTDSLKRRGD